MQLTVNTMIGGGMMQRACTGDNYEAELPVVSVVIPENYTDIPAYAFADCETLETVICYAPVEMLNDSMFSNCTSLREVIFVNGVGGIGNYVFDNCPNLETVYVGPYVETVGEYAFCDAVGEELWSLDKCITDPADMPDIDALLESVKCDPVPAPTPAPTPAPAVPVGEEGKSFFGVWNGTEMIMDGESLKLADFGMTMTLVLLEDGRMIFTDEEIDLSEDGLLDELEAPGWRVENGVAVGEGCTMVIDGDGKLVLDEDGSRLIFERSGDAPAAADGSAAPSAEAGADQAGVRYVCVSADVEGFTLDAAMLGEGYAVTLLEDGTLDFAVLGSLCPALAWEATENGFVIDYYGIPMEAVWTETGFDLNYFDTMMLHFVPAN